MQLIALTSSLAAVGLAANSSDNRLALVIGAGAVAGALAGVVVALVRRAIADKREASRSARPSMSPPIAAPSSSKSTEPTPSSSATKHGDGEVRSTELGTQAVLEAFAEAARSVAPVLSAHLWLLDEATDTLRPVSSVGDNATTLHPVASASGALGQAVESGAPVMGAYDEIPGGKLGSSRYAVPVSAGDTLGAVAVDLGTENPDRLALDEIAARLEASISAALAVDVLESEYAAAEAMLRAAAEIVHLCDPQTILYAALDKAMEVSRAQTGSVMLVAPDGAMRIRAARGLPEAVVRDTVVRQGEGIAGVVQATGRSLVIEDLNGRGPQARRHGVISAITVPVSDDAGVVGVLNVGSREFTARRSARVIEALEVLGKVTAAALRNARDISESGDRYLETVRALAVAIEAKDPYSLGSVDRAHELVGQLAERLGLPDEERQAVTMAALLHDIGMPAAGVLSAAGTHPLTTVEQGLVKMHPRIAADALAQVPALVAAVPIIFHHHERWDGSGYVLGLAGDEIPLGSRILAVVDSYVAMTSPRAYRTAMSPREALEEIAREAGAQFDPRVARAFIEMAEAAEAVAV